MSAMFKQKYIWVSALASMALPLGIMFLLYLGGIGSYSTAEAQGFVSTLMVFPVIFVFQALAYSALGNRQLKREKPSLVFGSLVGACIAIPFTLFAMVIQNAAGAPFVMAVLGSMVLMFLPLWLSFTIGAAVQCHLMGRDRK